MSDGRALEEPFQTDTLEIYPGERYSVILKPEDQISDYIQVQYFSMINNQYLHTNFIGINQNSFPVGISEMDLHDTFNVFPNPARNKVQVVNATQKVNIYNITGILLGSINVNSSNFSLDISYLKPGMYFLQDGSGQTQKIIKK